LSIPQKSNSNVKIDPFKIVLSTIDPEYQSNIELEKIAKSGKNLLISAIELAKKNGLYYYFLHKLKNSNVEIPFLRDEWNNENKKLLIFKKTLELLSDISNNYGTDYIWIKRYDTLPHVPRDIDIFIHRQQRKKIMQLLQNKNMHCLQSGTIETALEGGGYMRVDIYTEITYVSVNFIDSSYLWNSRTQVEIFDNKYWGLLKEADFLLTLVHNFIGHRRVSLLDFLHLKFLRKQVNIEACRKYAYGRGWGKLFDLTLKKIMFLEDVIYKDRFSIHFPYLFDKKFILNCISAIDELKLNEINRLFLYISFMQDEILERIKKSSFYRPLRSFKTARNLVNSFGAHLKKLRGDTKSL